MDPFFTVVLFSTVTFAVGAALTWLFLSSGQRSKIELVRSQARAEGSAVLERLQNREAQLEELRAVAASREQTIAGLQEEIAAENERSARLETRLTEQAKAAEEKLQVLEEAKLKLAGAFDSLSKNALESNNKIFLDFARATLEKFQEGAKGELEQRQKAIGELVSPLKESLEKVDSKIQELENARGVAYATLTEQIKSLSTTEAQLRTETGNLVRALRTPQVRGRWGEVQLRRAVEMAGMIEYCDFVQQESVETERGQQRRPDLIVKLPSRRLVVVDSKAPLLAYLEAVEEQNEAVRTEKLRTHARQVRDHLSGLSTKAYWDQFDDAPDFVVMFLPGEPFFSAALEHDPTLIEYGVEQRVLIATPTTLIALLRAIHYGWRQERIEQEAQEISKIGKELYDRLHTLSEHFLDLRAGLERAVGSYNKAVGSFEKRVFSQARRFKEKGAATGEDLPSIEPIESELRRVSDERILGLAGAVTVEQQQE